ncbi:MAG TPA: lipopolysaccharide heptosyltransferase II [Candidatus Latescibacteria bacterium]|nr:lipopolysaccharide heptosyltransferase II [Candidatus Latescibacterota bacterium]
MPRTLIVQTAFIGDVVLALPMASALRDAGFKVDFLVAPRTAELLASHPDVSGVLVYDKRGRDRGSLGFLRAVKSVREGRFDFAIIPHRSLRSALLPLFAGVSERIGFSGPFSALYTCSIPRSSELHEVLRNFSLLEPLGISPTPPEPPWLSPGRGHRKKARAFLSEHGLDDGPIVALAPGSVWPTKRWPPDGFREVAKELLRKGIGVVLVGGPGDIALCGRVADGLSPSPAVAAGKMSLMESAALLELCSVLVSNDSAPVHIASAVGTKVVALFGPTVPAFGFGPYGREHSIVELDLPCRPCSSHGGKKCPKGHFMCMKRIAAERVLEEVLVLLGTGT